MEIVCALCIVIRRLLGIITLDWLTRQAVYGPLIILLRKVFPQHFDDDNLIPLHS